MNKLLLFNVLLSQFDENNSEYENLNEEERKCMDFVDECLKSSDEKFGDACVRAMLLLLDAANKLDTDQELTNEEATLQKKELLSGFSQEDQDKLELFMYACVQIMGIYSEKSIEERRNNKEKPLIKK